LGGKSWNRKHATTPVDHAKGQARGTTTRKGEWARQEEVGKDLAIPTEITIFLPPTVWPHGKEEPSISSVRVTDVLLKKEMALKKENPYPSERRGRTN